MGPNTVVTRPVLFNGRYLFVNADLTGGLLRAQIEDVDGRPIAPYTMEASLPTTGNQLMGRVVWREASGLGRLAGRPVRIRFEVTGRLFAFWVSRSERGESAGFVGAGGPGYLAARDE